MLAGIAITNTDYTPCQLRLMARKCKDANHSRRLLAIAEHAGVGLQTLRDWILRYNEEGPSGLQTKQRQGRPPILGMDRLLFLRNCLETGQPPGLSAWTLSWLRGVIDEVFKVTLSLETIRQAIRKLGFRKLAPRPFHPKVDVRLQEEFRRDFHRIAKDHLPPGMDPNRVDVWFQDEARIGQKGMLSGIWALKGTRPRISHDYCYGYCYLFSALCPATGEAIGHVCDRANTIEMNRHLKHGSQGTPCPGCP